LKFVVCKPLQHHCHHSPEAYFSPQNASKPFGSQRSPRPLSWLQGWAPRKGKEGRGREKTKKRRKVREEGGKEGGKDRQRKVERNGVGEYGGRKGRRA